MRYQQLPRRAAVFSTLATAIFVAPASAQQVDLSTLHCKEFFEGSQDRISYVVMWLDGYYADRALKDDYRLLSEPPVAQERHRPGEALPPLEHMEPKEWVTKYVRDVDSEIMRFRVCGKCHTVSLNQESNQGGNQLQFWKVEPVGFSAHRFPKADFNHDKHKTQDCTDCHDAEKSEHSEDVLLKGIASCRECHSGIGTRARDKVASTCIDCHGFHISRSLAMDGKKLNLPAKAESFSGIKLPSAGNNVNPGSVVP